MEENTVSGRVIHSRNYSQEIPAVRKTWGEFVRKAETPAAKPASFAPVAAQKSAGLDMLSWVPESGIPSEHPSVLLEAIPGSSSHLQHCYTHSSEEQHLIYVGLQKEAFRLWKLYSSHNYFIKALTKGRLLYLCDLVPCVVTLWSQWWNSTAIKVNKFPLQSRQPCSRQA